MSTAGYIEALIAQGGCLTLLSMLNIDDEGLMDSCQATSLTQRIRYKSALCLGTIAASSYGLKSIYALDGKDLHYWTRRVVDKSTGAPLLLRAIESEAHKSMPVAMLCHSMLSRIQAKYHQETMV